MSGLPDLSPLLYVPLVVLLCAVTVIDIRTRRIPNPLSLAGILVALAVWAWLSGWLGIGHSMLGMVVGFGVFLPFYLLRGMGAGDVKLMTAVGAFLGPIHVFAAAIVVAIVGGIFAAVVATRQGRLGDALRDSLNIVLRRAPARTLGNSAPSEVIPYGLAISVGVLLYLQLMV